MAKKFSVTWEDDEITAVLVDGSRYKSLDQIPSEDDRDHLTLLMSAASDLDFDLQTGKPAKFPGLIFPLFLGVAVLMWVIFGVATVLTARAMGREISTHGVVLDLTVRQDSEGNEFYYPLVEYTLADGSLKRVQTSEGSYPPAYYAGQQVTVLYDPNQPLVAHIQSTSNTITRWTLSIIFGIMGLAFTGASFFVRWIMKDEPEPAMTRAPVRG